MSNKEEDVEITDRSSVVFTKAMEASGSASDFAQEFDFVAVFPLEEDKSQTAVCKHFCRELLHAKFELFAFLSVQDDELYVLINATEDILKKFADKIDYEMELDPEVCEKMMRAGDKKNRIAPVEITHFPDVTTMRPYDFIYGKYDEELDESLFKRQGEDGELFGDATKLKLIYGLVEGPQRLGGCGLPIGKLIEAKALLAFYPLHYDELASNIKTKMTKVGSMPWTMPKNSIKKYFGEKVALYFCFLGNYSYFLLFPAIVGLIFQLVVWSSGNYSHPILPFFSVFICCWAIVMLENWKQEEKRIALKWGMNNFEDKELDRPEFKGTLMNSFIDGTEFKYFPEKTKSQRVAYSLCVITTMILLVVGVVTGIYVLRFALQNSSSAPYASLVASVLNTVQITIFNMIYSELSVYLTSYENHRTDTQYEDAMIVKSFSFQFINSYASFFFLAFIASSLAKPKDDTTDNVGQCGATTCMAPLSLNIAIIFGTRITLTNALDIGIPYYNYTEKRKAETEGVSTSLTRPEEGYLLAPYNIMIESIKDYADTANQFGFMTLFITALPIACAFALISNMIKCRISAVKMFTLYQRPVPKGAQDIGNWQDIFALISTFAVLTNGAMICFTMDVLKGFSLFGRSWIFIGFQWTLISVQYFLAAVIPDESLDVEIQKRRTDFITSKLIDHVADEDYDIMPNGVPKIDSASAKDGDAAAKLIKNILKKKHGVGETKPIAVGKYPRGSEPWPNVISTNASKRGVATTKNPLNK